MLRSFMEPRWPALDAQIIRRKKLVAIKKKQKQQKNRSNKEQLTWKIFTSGLSGTIAEIPIFLIRGG